MNRVGRISDDWRWTDSLEMDLHLTHAGHHAIVLIGEAADLQHRGFGRPGHLLRPEKQPSEVNKHDVSFKGTIHDP